MTRSGRDVAIGWGPGTCPSRFFRRLGHGFYATRGVVLVALALLSASGALPSAAVRSEAPSLPPSVAPATEPPGRVTGSQPGSDQDEKGARAGLRDRARTGASGKARRHQAGNLVGHGGPIKAVASDMASGRIITGSFDYSLMAWEVGGDSPRRIARFAAFEGAVNAVALVPDSDRWVAAGDDQSVWIGDLGGGQPTVRLRGHTGKINAISVSPDGRFAVSASWDRTARIWELEPARPGPVLEGHAGPVNGAIFSADGETVYTASYDGTLVAWRRADGIRLRTVSKHGWGLNVLARLPGNGPELLVMGAVNGTVHVLDATSGEEVKALPAHQSPVLAIAVTAKPGLVAIGSGDGLIRVLRLGDWMPIEEFQNAFGPVWALAFVADGTALYYGSLDDFALRWQINPRAAFEPVDSQYPRRFQVRDGQSLGERQFARKCSVCHTLSPDDRNRAGPTLYGIFGRTAGSLAGYPYSDALRQAGIVWNEETIGRLFELGPDHYTPGSKMPLQKITDRSVREALIEYLRSATTDRPDGGARAAGSRPEQ